MLDFFGDLKTLKEWEKATSREEVLTAYVRLHVALVRIHPFWDGNGRIARLIANVPVIKAGLPPIIIPREGRKEYIDALSAYHLAAGQATARKELLPMADKLEKFQRFCTRAWAASLKLVEDARKKQRQRSAV